jgi:hypothetical protein
MPLPMRNLRKGCRLNPSDQICQMMCGHDTVPVVKDTPAPIMPQ